ncbi:hypothetical protein ACLB2K_029545 [Fragaria x ananassa]
MKNGGDSLPDLRALQLEDMDSSVQPNPSLLPTPMSYANSLINLVDRYHQTMTEEFEFSEDDCVYSPGKHGHNVSFSFKEDMNTALCDGPWILAGKTLIVRKWRPDLDPDESIGKMALWVRIAGLPVKYFKKYTLAKIGKIIGEVVKDKCTSVHVTTDVANNENVVNSVSDVNVDNVMLDTQVVQDIQTESNEILEVLKDVIKEDMGPWMLMSNKNKRKAGGNGGGRKHAPSGSRFDVLNEEGGNESGEAEHITLIGSKGVSPPIVKLWQSFDDKMKSAVSSGKNKSFNNSITNMENATSPLVYNHLLGLTFLKPL